uniref:polynucleotide adenylyltransferase n=1 Tax=Monopterus albus TaxID=43700 RepID=A0A3Q3QLN4_MONAL|nr:poly(A) RNA polymerase GLD2 isoform X1 [Monopterus albus]XP_020450233.1 poly(A) RNA polymerase GLD2 isoform X1 [Monopterus albus]XP_020450234.1 poly(A) RNA polymerase GLD2 isoform X1 [Monopterus albus]
MYPHSPAPRGASAYSNGLYSQPPAPRYYDYNHQSPTDVNSFYVPRVQRLPPYEWKHPPSTASVSLPHTPNMTSGHKRQNGQYSPHVVKRQRLDSSPHPRIGSPVIRGPPPPSRPDQVVTGSLRPSFNDFDDSYPSPHSHSHHHGLAGPESSNSLQAYAKDKLSDQMVELFEACQQQASDLTQKEICRARLQQDIQCVFADARLYLTGSSMNGLGCRSSDADLCLVLKEKTRADPLLLLSALQRLFKSLSYLERTQLIRAKVPILRFREKGSDLEFDLNINNTVGIRNTFLLRSYAYADLRIRPMILVIKKWARHNQINDASKGTLSSYTLVLMVLHYLQTRKEPVLPSLQRDYPECFNPFMDINMVPEGSKQVPPYISRNPSSLGDLFLGFLKYYAMDFRWDKQVISVREGRALPKPSSKEWRNKYICVEEPFEKNNVARAVHEKMKFDAIKAQFVESCQILQQRKDLDSILPVRAIINKESSKR